MQLAAFNVPIKNLTHFLLELSLDGSCKFFNVELSTAARAL